MALFGTSIHLLIGYMIPIIGQGGPDDTQSIKLSTKSGSWIGNERRQEFPPEILHAHVQAHESYATRVGARLRTISATYNCVGMVFANRRVWIDSDLVRDILKGDGLKRVNAASDIEIGDVVLYVKNGEVVHVGLVSGKVTQQDCSIAFQVISKWGADGEYFHQISELPEFLKFDTLEYWTDRKGV